VQQWFNLSDPGVEEALYESAALQRSARVDLGVAPAPDETTILRFRHLLEKHELGGLMLEAVNMHLEASIRLRQDQIPGHREKSQPVVRQLRPGEPLPASQTSWPCSGSSVSGSP